MYATGKFLSLKIIKDFFCIFLDDIMKCWAIWELIKCTENQNNSIYIQTFNQFLYRPHQLWILNIFLYAPSNADDTVINEIEKKNRNNKKEGKKLETFIAFIRNKILFILLLKTITMIFAVSFLLFKKHFFMIFYTSLNEAVGAAYCNILFLM